MGNCCTSVNKDLFREKRSIEEPVEDEFDILKYRPESLGLSDRTTFVSELLNPNYLNIGLSKENSGSSSPSTPVQLSSFSIEKLIGRGSYAKVFLVTKKDTGEQFAMKVLKKSKMESKKDVKRLFIEKDIISYITHPFIVKLHYTFQTESKAYFILDLLNGGDLYTHIIQLRKLKESQARFYCAEIVLHQNAKDLKPQNIIIDNEGHIKLTDFGLSKQNFDQSLENTICGTMKYIAPETISGKRYNHMADWWSLGIITYRMLTGELPHPTKINKRIPYYIVNQKLSIDESKFSPEAFSFLTAMLERDPKKRLGARGIDEIKDHPFFKSINWEKLYDKELKPPFVPNNRLFLSDTAEGGIEDTPDCRYSTANMTNEFFDDFTYPKDKTLTDQPFRYSE